MKEGLPIVCDCALSKLAPALFVPSDCKDFLDLFFIDTSPFVEAYHAASWGGDWTGLNPDWDQQLSGQIQVSTNLFIRPQGFST
jgi:hypothetical protein